MEVRRIRPRRGKQQTRGERREMKKRGKTEIKDNITEGRQERRKR